jgi:hypothetical protein
MNLGGLYTEGQTVATKEGCDNKWRQRQTEEVKKERPVSAWAQTLGGLRWPSSSRGGSNMALSNSDVTIESLMKKISGV